MKVNYSNEPVFIDEKLPSIFLAGPTPRSTSVKSWRDEAVDILKKMGFYGIIYVPEQSFNDLDFDYTKQVLWERQAMEAADTIVFWIPRSLELPGFTTNVEFGFWIGKHPEKVVYGRPQYSEKNRYLDFLYKEIIGDVPYETLEATLVGATFLCA